MNKILNFFRVDIWRKLLALAFACLLYWVIDNSKQSQGEIISAVPIEVNVASNLFISPGDYRVQLTVKGPEDKIKKMRTSPPKGYIMISTLPIDAQDGQFKLTLQDKHFKLEPRVQIEKIEPAVIILPIQRRITRSVPVKVNFAGKPLDGFMVQSRHSSPERVEVSGPRKAVEALTALTTDPVNLTFDRDFSTEVNLINPVPSELNISTEKVKVNIEIAKQESSIKSFADIPVRFLTDPARNTQQIASVICHAMPATVKVTLSGSTTDIARVTPQDIRVFADVSEPQYSAPGQYRVQLAAQLTGIAAGGKVQVINLLPQTVQVTVEPGKVEPAVKKMKATKEKVVSFFK